MIFRIADCAYRTKVLPGNRATDGKKKAGPRKEGRPCVILCWHVRAASRTCRSAMRRFGKLLPFRLFRRLYLHRASLPGLRHMAESPRSFRFGEKRLPSRLPKEQKSRLRLRRAAICFCQSLRYLLYYFTSRNRRRSHYCRRPPAIVLRRLPFRLLPLRIGPLRSDPAGRFAGRYTYPAKPLAMHC